MIRPKSSGQRAAEDVLGSAILCWPGAAFLMLAIGIVHGDVLPAVQPIGYWPAFGLWWVLALTCSFLRWVPDWWES